MISLAVAVALALSAAPAERHTEFREPALPWKKLVRSGDRLAASRLAELRAHHADELEKALMPAEIVRLGGEAVQTHEDATTEGVRELRRSTK